MAFLERIKKLVEPVQQPAARTIGKPPSGNGASSFHLKWETPPVEFVEVSATFELLEPPTVEMLYFWAVQVTFVKGRRHQGGAHFGLQYNPLFPESSAVNWGGYHDGGGGELEGSVPDLPSTPNHINTRDYPWLANRQYRFRIHKAEEGWRGTITDLETETTTVVRDLYVDADRLLNPMVWSEVFAHCDHPSVAVRWSDLTVVTSAGEAMNVDTVNINYQTHALGGCANTNSSLDDEGFVQRTNTERITNIGERLVFK